MVPLPDMVKQKLDDDEISFLAGDSVPRVPGPYRRAIWRMKGNGSGIGLWLEDADAMTYAVLKAVTHEEQLRNQVERARSLGFESDGNDGERLLFGCEVHVLSVGEADTRWDLGNARMPPQNASREQNSSRRGAESRVIA